MKSIVSPEGQITLPAEVRAKLGLYRRHFRVNVIDHRQGAPPLTLA